MSRAVTNFNKGLAKGSIKDIAERKGISMESAMAEAEVIVIVDISGSMNDYDGGSKSRWERAKDELERLQAQYEGKVALMSFSDNPRWNFDGMLPYPEGCTALDRALDMAAPFSGVYQLILITDGQPNSREAALNSAKKLRSAMHVIYIGADGDSHAKQFLNSLADATGGQFLKTAPELLSGGIKGLLA